MEDVYQKLSLVAELWKSTSFEPETHIEVTETWLAAKHGKVSMSERRIEESNIPEWLETTTRNPSEDGADQEYLVQRIVWARFDTKHRLYMKKDIHERLAEKFGLELAWSYSRSVLSGLVELPTVCRSSTTLRPFVFNYLPKMACQWTHTTSPSRPPLVSACMFIRGDQKDKSLCRKSLYRKTLSASFPLPLLCQPHFLAYTLALMLGVQNDHAQLFIQEEITRIEGNTGYHLFQDRPEGLAAVDIKKLSAIASGLATKLASVERKRAMVADLLETIEDECSSMQTPEQIGTAKEGRQLLMSQVEALKRRHRAQGLDTKYILKRVEIQIQALFHMITSDEAAASLNLTNEMSQIAHSTYRDAASMKTLAVVTMFFLPGSFVSALFSTPLFNWDARDEALKSGSGNGKISVSGTPQLDLYWIITIPLTVGVFIAYGFWLWWVRRGMKGRQKEFHVEEKEPR